MRQREEKKGKKYGKESRDIDEGEKEGEVGIRKERREGEGKRLGFIPTLLQENKVYGLISFRGLQRNVVYLC
jgi:hypothetical protein